MSSCMSCLVIPPDGPTLIRSPDRVFWSIQKMLASSELDIPTNNSGFMLFGRLRVFNFEMSWPRPKRSEIQKMSLLWFTITIFDFFVLVSTCIPAPWIRVPIRSLEPRTGIACGCCGLIARTTGLPFSVNVLRNPVGMPRIEGPASTRLVNPWSSILPYNVLARWYRKLEALTYTWSITMHHHMSRPVHAVRPVC